ncbi:MAG: hypothetical protein ACYTJ0_16200 [Planctomycetota bacterium]|jgi:hypothetical protein
MRVLVDDSDCGTRSGSVADAVAQIAEELRERGRIIVEVDLDGRRCAGAELDELLDGDGAGPDPAVVRLTTADPADQVGDALAAATRELGTAGRLQQEAAELIEAGDASSGMQRLGQALEIWGNVQQIVTLGVELVALPLDAATVDGMSGRELVAGLDSRLREVVDALRRRDPVGLSDTLLYDMPEITQRWRDLLAELQRMIGKGQP